VLHVALEVLQFGSSNHEVGIRPKYIRFGDFTARGYTLEDVEAAFRRYVPWHRSERRPLWRLARTNIGVREIG
jgi:hypothetical protein